jgi:hypothetical protein
MLPRQNQTATAILPDFDATAVATSTPTVTSTKTATSTTTTTTTTTTPMNGAGSSQTRTQTPQKYVAVVCCKPLYDFEELKLATLKIQPTCAPTQTSK